MMIVKEIYVEAKRSKNFQTFTVGKTITIEDSDDEKEVLRKEQHSVNKAAEEYCNNVIVKK